VVIVWDEPEFVDEAATALGEVGSDVLALTDPMVAWDALQRAKSIELLITCVNFAPGKPNGVALGRMARIKRPEARILFVGLPELEEYTDGLGVFMPSPITVPQVVETYPHANPADPRARRKS
jgi:hypothetical protein